MDLKFRGSSCFPLFFLRFLRREEIAEQAGAHVARGKARAARRPAARAVVHATPANFRKLLAGQLKKLVVGEADPREELVQAGRRRTGAGRG